MKNKCTIVNIQKFQIKMDKLFHKLRTSFVEIIKSINNK